MRVIAGNLGGRAFKSPDGHRTHPMSDRVRGALFNALGDIDGLTMLDAFTGSGAISFEAVSRGAAHVTALDIDKRAFNTAVKNAEELGVADRVKVIRAGAAGWSSNNSSAQFDLVICDPPYDDIQPKLLEKLAHHVKPGGVIVYSLPPKAEFFLATNYQLLTSKNYGDARLAFYRKGAG